MDELTKSEFATYTWHPSQAENTRAMHRVLARAEAALARKDLEDWPGECEDVYNRFMAQAIGFASI